MAEYVVPPSRPVIKIAHPVLTPQQEQEKWLAEGISAVAEKGVAMRQAIATATAAAAIAAKESADDSSGAARYPRTTRKRRGFMHVITAAASLLDELRTDALTPHNYYELYMKVFDELQSLQQYMEDEYALRKHSLEDMYEAVQYTGHLVPRLYLLITVGAVYMASGVAPALAIFQDLVEMCKGEQHPTRGLFLRHFLLSMTKNRLPGDMSRRRPNDAEADGGTPLNTARLLTLNAREMNWLWIRMEAKWYGQAVQSTVGGGCNAAAAARRMQSDRKELRVLVGMNLVRISQLEGIDVTMYKDVILPQLIALIVNYREPVAQQYLFEVLVQVFPDEFHLLTLESLLGAVPCLTVTVDVCAVLRSLMDRLGNYAVALREGRTEAVAGAEEGVLENLVGIFLEKLEQMPISYATRAPELKEIKRSSSAPPVNPMMLGVYVNTMANLVRMAVRVSPGTCSDNISSILQCVADKFAAAPTRSAVLAQERADDSADQESQSTQPSPCVAAPAAAEATAEAETDAPDAPAITPAAQQAAERLITSAVEQVEDMNKILGMDGLASLVGQLPFRGRRAAALAVVETGLKSVGACRVSSLEGVSRLFELLDPLLCDQADAPDDSTTIYAYDPVTEFREEQQTVCQALHLLHHPDPVVHVKMLNGARKLLGQGGPLRMPYTFPALAARYTSAALRLYVAYKDAMFAVEEAKLAAKHRDPAADAGVADEGGGAVEAAGEGTGAAAGKKRKSRKAAEDDEDDEGAEENGTDAKKRLPQLGKQLAKTFRHLHSGDGKGILEVLSAHDSDSNRSHGSSIAAFHAYLTAANAADTCELPDTCYELYTVAFTLYEEHAADSHHQVDMLASIINSLCSLANMPADGYRTLATKACRYCSKLVKKPDQSRMVAQCANLFARRLTVPAASGTRVGKEARKNGSDEPSAQEGATSGREDGAAAGAAAGAGDGGDDEDPRAIALECLERALRTAKQVVYPLQQLALYVDLLNIFLHFFASKTVRLEASYVNAIIDTIRTLSEAQRGEAASATTAAAASSPDASDKDGEGAEGSANGSGEVAVDKAERRRVRGDHKEPGPTADESAQEAADMAATYEVVRQIYRNTTKYIRTRQSVDPRWEEIEVKRWVRLPGQDKLRAGLRHSTPLSGTVASILGQLWLRMEDIVKDVEELRQIFLHQHQREQLAAAVGHTGAASTPEPTPASSQARKLTTSASAACAQATSPTTPSLTGDLGEGIDEESVAGTDGCLAGARTPPTAAPTASPAAVAALKARLAEVTTTLREVQREHEASTIALAQQVREARRAEDDKAAAEARAAAAEARHHDAQTTLQQQAEQLARLSRSLRLCRAEVSTTDGQWDSLVAAVSATRAEATALAAENARLRRALDESRAVCEELRGEREAHEAARVTLASLEAERAAREAEWAALAQHFAEAKAAVAEGVTFWAAVREEHEAVEEALAVSQAANAIAWAAAAGGRHEGPTRATPPSVAVPEPSDTDTEVEVEVEGEAAADTCDPTAASRDAHACRLEEKLVDLAVALQAAQAETRALRDGERARTAHPVATVAAVAALQVTVHTLQSALQPLAESQARQAAALQVSEGVVEPLMDQYEQLLALYTAEVHHTYVLEAALALASADGGGRGAGSGVAGAAGAMVAVSGSGGGGHGSRPPVMGSRRQTFSYAALREREAQLRQQSLRRPPV